MSYPVGGIAVDQRPIAVMPTWRILKKRMRILVFITTFPLLLAVFILLGFQSNLADEDPNISIFLRNDLKQKEYIDKRGIHVIVGHYIGNDLPWDPSPNLTDVMLNHNGYAPLSRAGHMGDAYFALPSERKTAKLLYHINKFNLLVSDRIPVNRSLPDVRRSVCIEKSYPVLTLPDTSIIIVFHNEAWSTLLRTVHSIINRSPKHLVKEIILVDDASSRAFLKKPLEDYVSQLPLKVKIVRSLTRTGLIRARLLGVNAAKGKVLTFLDAHCECSKGWLEPLLTRVASNRSIVACPVIDIIHDDTFAYVRSFELHWGAFNWELHFRWYPTGERELNLRKNDTSLPFKTPVMAGGLFSIDRQYFEDIGKYDEQMDIWGGENIELSFRVWQCGGSIEIVPCSHVGHVFRKSSPYTFPRPGGVGAVLYSNLARVAATWMDQWKDFYFKMNPEAAKENNHPDVSARLELRERLKCNNFEWYLDNVWPEHFLPTKNRFFGKIRSKQKGKCFQKSASKGAGQAPIGKLQLSTCVFEMYPKQLFVYTKDGRIMSDESVCLDSPESAANTYVVVLACNNLERQRWLYDHRKQSIVHSTSKLCLDLPSKVMPDAITLQTCNNGPTQKWILEKVDWTRY